MNLRETQKLSSPIHIEHESLPLSGQSFYGLAALSTVARSLRLRNLVLLVCVGMLATACARGDRGVETDGTGSVIGAAEGISDPLEGFNRAMFAFNDKIDAAIIEPTAKVYRFILPEPIRLAIRSFLRNLETPVILANDLLQGEFARAEQTTARFLINSIVGVGGMFDVATDFGIERHEEDFGQTLAVWGLGDGLYLVLPLLGPSSARDGIGMLADSFMDPLSYVGGGGATQTVVSGTRTLVSGVDTRAENIEALDQIREDSIDFYARIRSMYHQHRQFLIANGDDPNYVGEPDIFLFNSDGDLEDIFGDDFEDAFGSDFTDESADDRTASDETDETDDPSEDSASFDDEDPKKDGIEVELIE